MSQNAWMVRNDGGELFESFKKKKFVAIGPQRIEDVSTVKDYEAMKLLFQKAFPENSMRSIGTIASFMFKFALVFQKGDGVVTYDPENRVYLVGEMESEYQYLPDLLKDKPHTRKVKWLGEVGRDLLTLETRNSLGTYSTIFNLSDQVWGELQEALNASKSKKKTEETTEPSKMEDLGQVAERQIKEAFEVLKDKILALDPRQAEHLVAALLRAMGYKAKVTPVGPDRNLDVFASPDGLGLQEPIIKAEVKHQKGNIGAKEIRSFGATIRSPEKGLFVSTGGFSKDAKYEAANFPVTLIGLDDLAHQVIEHYENFDEEGRKLIPLVRIYWPAE